MTETQLQKTNHNHLNSEEFTISHEITQEEVDKLKAKLDKLVEHRFTNQEILERAITFVEYIQKDMEDSLANSGDCNFNNYNFYDIFGYCQP